MIRCPEEVRTENRRKALDKIWKSLEWDFQKQLFLSRYSVCQWCKKKPSQVPHHPTLNDYGTPNYIKIFLSGCIALCNRCHHALHKGLQICPVCHDHYMAPGKQMCKYCDPETPAREEAREIRKYQIRNAQRAYRKARYQAMKGSGT